MGLVKKYLVILLAGLVLAACNAQQMPDGGDSVVGQPVLFSSGNMAGVPTKTANGSTSPYYYGITNTSGVPYMAQDGRFVCTMYYHAEAGASDTDDFDTADGGTAATAWLKVNNNKGNSVYWNKEFTAVDESGLDTYGFDKSSTMFYWQNRLTHAFLALADYNQLLTNTGPSDEELEAEDLTTDPPVTAGEGKLKMYPHWDKYFPDLSEDKQYVNAYDLTRDEYMTSMAQQPDPILALTIMKPSGSTQESNRVRLYFRHQFSQIQVNLKGGDDNSANLTAEQIEKVELLGVSTEGYVCNRLTADGQIGSAFGKDVHLDEFTDEQLENNPWGTSFEMFDMATGEVEDGHDKGYATGYLKSFNAIAFGHLWAIRITWHEGTTANPGILHVTTYHVPQTNESNEPLQNLQSATKYIYNLELRRGTLAVIRTEILDWMQEERLVYGTEGTITN